MTDIKSLLSSVKTIAIVGAKDTVGHPVDNVGRYLINAGFTIFPVHPVRKKIWDLDAYATLAEVPAPIDLVDVFRSPEFCLAHAEECLALTTYPKVFWMQLGITNEQARLRLESKGIVVVENACLMVEYARLKQ